MMLTLVVDTDVNALLTSAEYVGTINNGGEAGAGGRLSLQLVDLSLIPAFAFRVAILLDSIVGVEVVQADLPTYS